MLPYHKSQTNLCKGVYCSHLNQSFFFLIKQCHKQILWAHNFYQRHFEHTHRILAYTHSFVWHLAYGDDETLIGSVRCSKPNSETQRRPQSVSFTSAFLSASLRVQELQAQLTQRGDQYHRLLDQGESMLLARGGEEAGPGTTQTQQNLAMLQNKWASLNTKMDDRRVSL